MPRGKTTKKSSKKDSETFSKLRKYNFIAAVLYALQGVLVLVLSDSAKGVQAVTSNFLAKNSVASEVSGGSVLSTASHHLFDLNIAYVVAAFFFISAIAHLIVATWRRKQYEADLQKGVNKFRWVAYAFSISTMMVAIALLTGIFDFASLLMVFALTALMSLLGLAMEARNQGNTKVDWSNYSLGLVTGLVPWLVLVIYVWGAVVYGSGVPGFVYWIYASLFILFAGFAANMYLQYKKVGRWSTYLYGEKVYIFLSLIAETVLAWQVFAGTLR